MKHKPLRRKKNQLEVPGSVLDQPHKESQISKKEKIKKKCSGRGIKSTTPI